MTLLKKFLAILITATFATVSYGSDETSDGPQAIATLAATCFINEGADEDDVEDALESLSKWAKKNHPGLLSALTPAFRAANESEYGDIILQSWMPFDSVGKFDEAIEEGDFQEDLQEAITCKGSSLGGWYGYYMSESFQDVDTGVVAYQHCSTLEGVSGKTVGEYASQEAAQIAEAGFDGVLAYMDRGVGDRNLPGDFSKVYAWPSMGSFANAANNFWNNNGWEFDEEFQSKVAKCGSGNIYRFRNLHRATQ